MPIRHQLGLIGPRLEAGLALNKSRNYPSQLMSFLHWLNRAQLGIYVQGSKNYWGLMDFFKAQWREGSFIIKKAQKTIPNPALVSCKNLAEHNNDATGPHLLCFHVSHSWIICEGGRDFFTKFSSQSVLVCLGGEKFLERLKKQHFFLFSTKFHPLTILYFLGRITIHKSRL